jgi:hypothetical protein
MPSIGQTWVLASIGAVVEMGVLSTLKRLLMESRLYGLLLVFCTIRNLSTAWTCKGQFAVAKQIDQACQTKHAPCV